MIIQRTITLQPFPRGFHLITSAIAQEMKDINGTGLLHLFIQHTSAGLTLNENADPSVRHDFRTFTDDLIPENHPTYTHVFEGSDDMPAHLKSSIIGNSVSIPISGGKLKLGTWQGIYLCEFRNHGGSRRLIATIIT